MSVGEGGEAEAAAGLVLRRLPRLRVTTLLELRDCATALLERERLTEADVVSAVDAAMKGERR